MKISFYKYQATGNDFIIIDNRDSKISLTKEEIAHLCDRKFGVGADGLMLIENDLQLNFKLQYFNSDGSQSLCGNGSRAAVHFASSLGIVDGKTSFNAFDGAHDANLLPNDIVSLKMNDVKAVKQLENDFFINTGSPHYIRFVNNIEEYPVYEEGKKIRYDSAFSPGGTNVNFVELREDNTIFVRTYERGVENETLSCGTGVTAAAIAAYYRGYASPVTIKTLGGSLSVAYETPLSGTKSGHAGTFTQIFLIGPAKKVFKGELEL